MNKHHLIVRYLVESGAATNIPNIGNIAGLIFLDNKTALDIAKTVKVPLINSILFNDAK